jgi:hypothetical protein
MGGGGMSRRLSWEERRQRLVEKVHRRVVSARASGKCARVVPSFARFAFLCGREGCSKPFGHRGKHGEVSDE